MYGPGKVASPSLSRSSEGSPQNSTLKVGYALRRKGEVVYSWHRVRLTLTERELIISPVSDRDFMLVGHMIDIISGSKLHNSHSNHLRYDLEEVDFHFFSFYFTWSVTGKKYGFQFDILSENRNVNKSFCFCFDTEEEQDEWEAAFRKVEGRVRTARQSYLTEANAKRREAVHNNISTLILIAKNFKAETNEVGEKLRASDGPGASGDSIRPLSSSQYSNASDSSQYSNPSLYSGYTLPPEPSESPEPPLSPEPPQSPPLSPEPERSHAQSLSPNLPQHPEPPLSPSTCVINDTFIPGPTPVPYDTPFSPDEISAYSPTHSSAFSPYIQDTNSEASDNYEPPKTTLSSSDNTITPRNPLGISLPREIPLFRDQSSSPVTTFHDSWASPPSSPYIPADIAESSGSAASAREWYYFSNKRSYKYYRVAPADEDESPTAEIDTPYYFKVAESLDAAVKDFPLPEQHPQVLGDFNRRFQEAVKGISVSRRLHITGQDLVKPYSNLIHISQDFIHTATTYGKIIINEVYLPPEKKKIKPIDVGGLAGGLKFIVQNILFKFAIDYFDLYGSDDAAAKVAGHDLRGLTHYFECGIEDLCVPLTMLLDYRGFRLICQAVMPISQDTICYGSSDGGERVHCSDIEVYEKLCRAAKMLNLKPHLCRNSRDIMLVSAIDLEGHRGKDKRHYLCDFSRVFPPELPHPNIRSSYMYRLLRPEFLRTLATPLCSDAYSWFIQKTPQEKEHNREVSLATHYLLNTTIPAFAMVLIKHVAEAAAKDELAMFRVTPHIHSTGINIRHCGHLISLIKNIEHPHNDSTIFIVHIEMVARILKCLIRVKLRTKMQELKLPLEEPYRCLLVDFLNLVFGNSPESTSFWNTTIASYLTSKFCYSITTTDLKHDLFSSCPGENGLQICFLRLMEMTNMKVAPRLLDQLAKNPTSLLSKKYIIHETDLLKIGFTTKQMNVVDFAQGFVLRARGDEYLKDDKATAKHFYNLALQKYEDSLHANPYNKWTLVNTAEVLTRLLELEDAQSLKQEEDRLLSVGRINKMYMRAINLDQNDSYSLYSYAKFLEKHSDNSVTVIEEFYLRSLENDPANCLCLSRYAQFLLKHNYPDYEPFKKLEHQLSSQLTQVKDLYSTLTKYRLDRQDMRIWQAKSHKVVKTTPTLSTRDKYLSQHRLSLRELSPPNAQKCTRCNNPFVPTENHAGQCAHVGTWHNSFLDCNLDCVFYLSGNFSFGIPHWSCCFSFNGTTTVCCRSPPHQGPEQSLRPLLLEDEDV